MANSLDAVSDRDFVLETLAAAAIAAVHLSRFAEEIVIWTSPLFGLDQALRQVHHRLLDHAAEAQPGRRRAGARQDRPDHRRAQRAADRDEGPAARLSEGHAGGQGRRHRRARRAGAVDRRHDRHGARHAARRGAHAEAAGEGYATATDLADWLVRDARYAVPRGPSRRPAASSRRRRRRRCRCTSCRWPPCRRSSRRITPAVFRVLSVERSVKSRTSYGGTAPKNVRGRRKDGSSGSSRTRMNATNAGMNA